MIKNYLFSTIFLIGILILNFSAYSQTSKNRTIKQQAVKYTCPMNPEIIRDLPGKCPKCGMKLIEVNRNIKPEMNKVHDSTMMKNDNKIMRHDSSVLKKGHMKRDSTSYMCM